MRIEATARRRGHAGAHRRALPGLEGARGRPLGAARARELPAARASRWPPGAHSVELRYEPASWRAGWIVSLLGCLMLVALTVAGPARPAAGRASSVIDAAAQGATRALRRRPVLAAALIYALLALVFVGPALAARQDAVQLRHALVPAAVGGRQAGRAGAAGQPRARRRPGAAAAVRALRRRPDPGDAALESLHRWAAARSWPTPSRPSSRLYNLPAYVLPFCTALVWIALLKLWVSAFGMFLLGRALGHALRRRADRRARLRVQPVDGHLGLLPAHERVVVDAVAAAA